MELRGLRATCDTHVHVLYLYSSGDQGIDLGDGQELERDTDGPFSKAKALRNLKTCFEIVCVSRQWIHRP